MQAKGFSLVELMISMALGLVLSAGVLTLYSSSQQNYLLQKETALILENQNSVIQFLEEPLHQTGFLNGCDPNSISYVNAVKWRSGENHAIPPNGLVEAYANTNAFSFIVDPGITGVEAGTDILRVQYLDTDSKIIVNENYTAPGAGQTVGDADYYFTVANGSFTISQAYMSMVIEPTCGFAASFYHYNGNNDPLDRPAFLPVLLGPSGIFHGCAYQYSSGDLRGSYTLKGGYDCDNLPSGDTDSSLLPAISDTNSPVVRTADESNEAVHQAAFEQGSAVFSIREKFYYLKIPTGATVPSLYEFDMQGGISSEQELVRGVKQIEYSYGFGEPGQVERYVDLPTVATDGLDWDDLVAIKLEVTMQSENQFTAGGVTNNLAESFTHVISLKNRL